MLHDFFYFTLFPKINVFKPHVNDFLIKESAIRKYIIDASVVFKWYYKKDEKDLRQAEILYGLLESDTGILLASEILNVLRLKKLIDNEKINNIISDICYSYFGRY